MLKNYKTLVEAKQLILQRLVRISRGETIEVIQEMQRTTVICRKIIEQSLTTLEECATLYQSCVISKAGVLEPETAVTAKFQDGILQRLQGEKPLDNILLPIIKATLLPVTRLFVEYGAIMQIEKNYSIVDHKVPLNAKKQDELRRLVERLDKRHWRWINLKHGQSTLLTVSTSIRKVLRDGHRSANDLSKEDDHA